MIRWHHLFLISIVLLPVTTHCRADQRGDAEDYWDTPIPLQTPSPPAPEQCGACHTDKYTDWSRSRHAQAFSPGLLGQIVEYAEADATSCLNCHAPMADQQEPLFQTKLETLAADMDGHRPNLLARHGVFCAACHIRDGVLNAPSASPSQAGPRVHDRIRTNPFLRDSRFCSTCHQFDATLSVNGKPLQDTYREWLDSPYPIQGRTCQSCHMPDQAHLFRGIHDPDMVRQGLTITTQATEVAATLVVQSTGIGHRFPTYIVPRVRLTGLLLDSDGHQIRGGYQEQILQRQMTIDNGRWIEHSDTRLEPGAAATLSIPWQAGGRCGNAVQFRIIVEPEWFYHEKVFPIVLEELEDGLARDLIKQARSIAETHSFVLFETILPHDCVILKESKEINLGMLPTVPAYGYRTASQPR